MTVTSLKAQLTRVLAQGHKLTSEEVRSLVAKAKDNGKVGANEVKLLAGIPADRFADPAVRDELSKMLDGTTDQAYVNVTTNRDLAATFGKPGTSGIPGVKIAFETGLGQLTQNCFELTGAATRNGTLTLKLGNQPISVKAKAGESAATIAARVAQAMPQGLSAYANTGYGEQTANVQIFKHAAMPAALVQPVQDGKVPPVRILVTGYGKFAHFTEDAQNPAWQMAQKLAALKIPGAQVQAICLPVEWSKVDEFSKTVVDQYKPDVIINLGYGRNTIEAWAENKTDGPDAAGIERHGEPADEAGPQWLQMTLPEEAIEKALDQVEDDSLGGRLHLRAGEGPQPERLAQAKQAQEEDSGNKYLCNYLNYKMLEVTRGQGISSGFFHVDETTAPQELEVVLQQATLAKLRERVAATPKS
ncbi:MAG TPA: hypothetical protein VGK67_41515 [Myxococcales bacterium]